MKRRSERGFTLIELVIVIVILGILAGVAIPKFFNLSDDAKKAATKGALGGLRSGVANFYAKSAVAPGATAAWPTVAQLTTADTVMASAIPDNPYDTDGTPNHVVDATGQTQGAVVGASGGWAYNPTNGKLWANTNTAGVGENSW
jgi:prepilin-type N-terminal cleavage/methylation domain-containing protein